MSFRIPARARRGILQPERAREIDDADARLDERRRELGGCGVGQCEEHGVHFAQDLGRQRRNLAAPEPVDGRQLSRSSRSG